MPLAQTRKPSVAEKSLLSQVLGLGFAIGTKATKATQQQEKKNDEEEEEKHEEKQEEEKQEEEKQQQEEERVGLHS